MTGINRTNPPQQWSSSSDLLFIQFNEGLVQLWWFEWNDQLMKICSNSYFWTKSIVKMADEFLCTWHISALSDTFFVSTSSKLLAMQTQLWPSKVWNTFDKQFYMMNIEQRPELINSIEITIAIDIFGTIAIAIVKRISQLLLLLLIRSSISTDFFPCLEYAVLELLQLA